MATHGRGGLQRWLIGSVADKVMRASPRPVLLITPHEPGQAAADVHLRRLLVPLDGSPLAEAALPVAVELAQAAHATLLLSRVEESITAISGGHAFVPDVAFWDEAVRKDAHTYLTQVQAQLPADIADEVSVVRGPVAPRLHDLAAERQVDLVVMSTRGQGGMRRLLLGSVADRLVRSGAPVLLVPPPTPERVAHGVTEAGLVGAPEG